MNEPNEGFLASIMFFDKASKPLSFDSRPLCVQCLERNFKIRWTRDDKNKTVPKTIRTQPITAARADQRQGQWPAAAKQHRQMAKHKPDWSIASPCHATHMQHTRATQSTQHATGALFQRSAHVACRVGCVLCVLAWQGHATQPSRFQSLEPATHERSMHPKALFLPHKYQGPFSDTALRHYKWYMGHAATATYICMMQL